MARGKPFQVDTSPTKKVLVESLTRDVTIEACIFDLIDNSIDAARDTIYRDLDEDDRKQLAESYAGFGVTVFLSAAGFKIVDTCGGIPVDKLKTMVLRFGQASEHDFGIGIFGVGLNRALFKLGRVSHLRTDTGSQRSELVLDTHEYLASADWELPAQEFGSNGKIGTEIEIRQLPTETARSFADAAWVHKLRESIALRYGRFIEKKFKIEVNGAVVNDALPHIRAESHFDPLYKFFKFEDVAIHVACGQHSLHRFTEEEGYEKEDNRKLTSSFGWTLMCNDRAILTSDQGWKTFWKSFHSEYYGFIGFVNFIGDPSKLPWTTTKDDVDLNSSVYQYAKPTMESFAETWRKHSNLRKGSKPEGGKKLKPLPQADKRERENGNQAKPAIARAAKTSQEKVEKPKPIVKIDHNELVSILPEDVDENFCFDKHLALVHEAKGLSVSSHPYSALALIRMLFECSAWKYFQRNNHLTAVNSYCITKREAAMKRSLTADEKKRITPSIDEMLLFIENEHQVFSEAGPHLRLCARKLGARQKMLNSAIHHPIQAINRAEAFQIRDDALPLLRHLIEK